MMKYILKAASVTLAFKLRLLRKFSMRFEVSVVDSHTDARRCNLVLEGANDITIATPACLFHTRHGLVPEMTIDLWEELDNLPAMFIAPMNTLLDKDLKLDAVGGGIGKLARLPADKAVFLEQNDFTIPYCSYGNTKLSVSVWGRGGRESLTPADFTRFVGLTQPHIYQVMCDNETPLTASRKRCSKAVERTKVFTEQCLEKLKESTAGDKCLPFGSVVGGWNAELREACSKSMGELPELKGFVIDGFRSNTTRYLRLSEPVSETSLKIMILKSLQHLPYYRPRFLPGIGAPIDVIHALRIGIDLFDGAFPFLLTEARFAWNFRVDDDDMEEMWFDFRDERFRQDFSPISSQCKCLACRQHTRSYIHHLVTSREIAGQTLLMLHNSQQYFRFFDEIRRSLAEGRYPTFARQILKQPPCPAAIFDDGDGDGAAK